MHMGLQCQGGSPSFMVKQRSYAQPAGGGCFTEAFGGASALGDVSNTHPSRSRPRGPAPTVEIWLGRQKKKKKATQKSLKLQEGQAQ